MKIRRATIKDCECVAKVLHGAFSPFREKYTDEAYAHTVVSLEEIKRRMTEGITWVADDDEHIIGTGSIAYTDDGLYVTGLAVLPEAQGKKVGRKLLEIIEDYALRNGHQRLHLLTTTFLFRAATLYHHFGFDNITQDGQQFKGVPVLSFEKWLKVHEKHQ